MKNRCLLFLFLFSVCRLTATDTVATKNYLPFVSARVSAGVFFNSIDKISPHMLVPMTSATLQFGYYPTGRRWQDQVYGMPYYGLGVYSGQFHGVKSLGTPLAVYLLQGARLARFSRHFSLNYEWNIGIAFNWKPYDPFDNPYNDYMGAPSSVYAGVSPYLKWIVNRHLDLRLGIQFDHFSNGASTLPNRGINALSPTFAVIYHIGRPPLEDLHRSQQAVEKPKNKPHFDYEISLTSSMRQVRFDTLGTGLPSDIVDYDFQVYGVNVAAYYVPNYRFKYGLTANIYYDESSNSQVFMQQNEQDGFWYRRVKTSPFFKCLSFGLAAAGEITMERSAIFANIGFNIIHSQPKDPRFYQVLGYKLYLQENLFGTFGIRLSNFGKAQFLYWSLGYTFNKEKNKG